MSDITCGIVRVYMLVSKKDRVCVCVCVCEKLEEIETEYVCVRVGKRDRVCVSVSTRERAWKTTEVSDRMRVRARASVYVLMCSRVSLC